MKLLKKLILGFILFTGATYAQIDYSSLSQKDSTLGIYIDSLTNISLEKQRDSLALDRLTVLDSIRIQHDSTIAAINDTLANQTIWLANNLGVVLEDLKPSQPNLTSVTSFTTRLGVTLIWDDTTNVDYYEIYRRCTSCGSTTDSLISNAGGTTIGFIDYTVEAFQTYQYFIIAVNTHGSSPPSINYTIYINQQWEEPISPVDLELTVDTTSSQIKVILTWRDRATTETGFWIENTTNQGANWIGVDTLFNPNLEAYVDSLTSFADSSTIRYKVGAWGVRPSDGDTVWAYSSNQDIFIPDTSASTEGNSDPIEITINGNAESGDFSNIGYALTGGEADDVTIDIVNPIEGTYSVQVSTDTSGVDVGRPMIWFELSENLIVDSTYIFTLLADSLAGDPEIFYVLYGIGGTGGLDWNITSGFTYIDTFVCTTLPPLANYIYMYSQDSYQGTFNIEVSMKKVSIGSGGGSGSSVPIPVAGSFTAGADNVGLVWTVPGELTPDSTIWFHSTDGVSYSLLGTFSGVSTSHTSLSSCTRYYYKAQYVKEDDTSAFSTVTQKVTTGCVAGDNVIFVASDREGGTYNGSGTTTDPYSKDGFLDRIWTGALTLVSGDTVRLDGIFDQLYTNYGNGQGIFEFPANFGGEIDYLPVIFTSRDTTYALGNNFAIITAENLATGGYYYAIRFRSILKNIRFEYLNIRGSFLHRLYEGLGSTMSRADIPDENPGKIIGIVYGHYNVDWYKCVFDNTNTTHLTGANKNTFTSNYTIANGSSNITQATPINYTMADADSNVYPYFDDYWSFATGLWEVPIMLGKLSYESCTFINHRGEDCLNFLYSADSISVINSAFFGNQEEFLDIAGGIGHEVRGNFATGFSGNGLKIHSQNFPTHDFEVTSNVIIAGNTAGTSTYYAVAMEQTYDFLFAHNTIVAGESQNQFISSGVPYYFAQYCAFFGERYGNWYYSYLHDGDIENNIFVGAVYFGDKYNWNDGVTGTGYTIDKLDDNNNNFSNNLFTPHRSNVNYPWGGIIQRWYLEPCNGYRFVYETSNGSNCLNITGGFDANWATFNSGGANDYVGSSETIFNTNDWITGWSADATTIPRNMTGIPDLRIDVGSTESTAGKTTTVTNYFDNDFWANWQGCLQGTYFIKTGPVIGGAGTINIGACTDAAGN